VQYGIAATTKCILLAMTGRNHRDTLSRMLVTCAECGHALWSEVRRHGAYRVVVHFDDDGRGATYAEHVLACPGCGGGLSRQALERHRFTFEPRTRRLGMPLDSRSA
jgi:hypothetical protein